MQQEFDYSSVKAILNVLRRKIARRTSEDEAASMLSRFIKELTPQYEFLKYVSINKTIYSESEAIWVAPELNQINDTEVFAALQELVKKSVREMKEKADFFFIREFQDAFENIDIVHRTVAEDISLNEMQHDYLIQRNHTLSLEKNQLIVNLIHALLSIENMYLSETESVQLMEKTLLELLPTFPFVHSIHIEKDPSSKGYYAVEINESIQRIPTYQFSDALYQLILKIGTQLNITNSEQFRQTLIQKLGKRNTELLRKVNLPIDNLYISSSRFLKQDLVHRLIDSLVNIVGSRTSEHFAVSVMMKMIDVVKQNQSLFQLLEMKKTDDEYTLSFSTDFEMVNNDDLRKAIKALIQAVGAHLGRKKGDFINELKLQLGKDYVSSIEKLGLNFHMLEIKFG